MCGLDRCIRKIVRRGALDVGRKLSHFGWRLCAQRSTPYTLLSSRKIFELLYLAFKKKFKKDFFSLDFLEFMVYIYVLFFKKMKFYI